MLAEGFARGRGGHEIGRSLRAETINATVTLAWTSRP